MNARTGDSKRNTSLTAAELSAAGYCIEHRHRTRRSGFKAGALAEGLAATGEPLIAMLDVDFRPPAHWLRDIVPVLLADPDAGFLQSRCEFSNYETNLLTRVQGMMLDAHFTIEQAGRVKSPASAGPRDVIYSIPLPFRAEEIRLYFPPAEPADK